jgi:hypothetical protein
LCVHILQQTEPAEDKIHLMWTDGTVLCGQDQPKRFWQRWNYNVFSWPDVCPTCLHAWTHAVRVSREEHFALPADDRPARGEL